MGWRTLKEIRKIIQEQAQSDMIRKTSFENRPSSPQTLRHEAEGAMGGISPQEDLIHFQKMEINPKGSRAKQELVS